MEALYVICNIILFVVAIALVVIVLMQDGNTQGLGSIAGGAETFLGKNKASTLDGKLKTYTKIGAVVFIVLALVMTLLSSFI